MTTKKELQSLKEALARIGGKVRVSKEIPHALVGSFGERIRAKGKDSAHIEDYRGVAPGDALGPFPTGYGEYVPVPKSKPVKR